MKWRKLGLIFHSQNQFSWMTTHAALPTADRVEDSLYRIYFSSRDVLGRSQIGFIVIDIDNPFRVLKVNETPVLTLGDLGAFDDSGTMLSWIVNYDGQKYIYYIGWNLGVSVPFRNAIGLALSANSGQTFCKYSKGPIIDRDIYDPFFTASSCVLIEAGLWRMWYLSCREWRMEAGKAKHYYLIKYAESKDGILWRKDGRVCIDFKTDNEYAISRPCVLREKGKYKMWYSYRGQSYRIGYAESSDGLTWQRLDHLAGIDVSDTGWDSEMICYPFVFDHNGSRYMLYNGNGYGRSGFGLAVLQDE